MPSEKSKDRKGSTYEECDELQRKEARKALKNIPLWFLRLSNGQEEPVPSPHINLHVSYIVFAVKKG